MQENTSVRKIVEVQNYLTERLEKKLGVRGLFEVGISYVPATMKWYAFIEKMPNISYEYRDLCEARDFDVCDQVIASFLRQIREYFTNV